MMITVTLPWPPKELSPNARLHWAQKTKHTKAYRKACWAQALACGIRRNAAHPVPVQMTVEFIPPDRRSYDKDNLIGRMKAGFDGLADAMGVDDKHFEQTFLPVSKDIGGMVKVCIHG